MLASQISTVNDYKLGETRWTYNNRGSLLSEKTFAYVSDTLQGKSYTYNSEELLLTSTNSIGQTTTYSQYNDWGKAGKIKDFRGNFTTYAFDGWGRNTSVSYPDGTTETFTLGAGTDGGFIQFNTATNEPGSRVYYDRLGREIATETQQIDGSWLRIDKTYDTKGNLYKVSLPHIGNSNVLWSTYTYDIYNRPISVVEASGKTTTWGYNGNSVTESLNKIATTRTYNALGQLIKVSDPSGTITYSLYADGRPSKIDASGILTTFNYDNYDRQIELVDPSAGKRTMAYDNAGNIISETDAKGNITKYSYDRYYRMTRKELVGELVTNYVYNSISGLLESETSNNGTWTKYKYDTLGRLIDEHKSAGTAEMNLRTLYTYNGGVVSEIAYSTEPIVNSQSRPIGVEKYEYSNGHLNKILWQDKAIWIASAINNSGQITTITTGPLMRRYQYDAYGLPTERQVTNTANRTIMQSFYYSFSPITGNLEWRRDRKHSSSENFLYDDLNRLKSFNGSTAAYDNKGNITNLSSVGSMTYSAAKPYAVESLTLSANSLQNTDQQSVSYNKMNLPSTITQGGKTATFTYNGSGERVRMSIPKPSTAGRIVGGFFDIHYYLGSKLEIIYDQSTKENKYIFYIGGDAYDAPAVSVQKGNLEWKTYYICRDYLGSITLITDASGNSVQELSYDAWGNLRDPLTYQVYACGKAPELFLGRGYTGHEHLSTFGLINMNARLYDPVLGRFLSPDPYVQMPDNLQSFNRYTYGMNNPLCYVDPSGETPWLIPVIAGAVFGAYSGGVIANEGDYNLFKWDYRSATTWANMFGGAIVGGISGYAGWAVAGSGIPMANTAGIATSSLINSVGTWAYTGGKTPITISLGAASYNFTNGEFGFLGKKGNKWYENMGYSFGALANLPDIISLFSGGGIAIDVNSASTNREGDEWWGHSSITNKKGEKLVSVGPAGDSGIEKTTSLIQTYKNSKVNANVNWNTYLKSSGTWKIRLNNISLKAIESYASKIAKWDLVGNSCVGHTTRALWRAGVLTLFAFHPHLLNAQLFVRQIGIYSSSYIYQIPK